MKITYLIFVFLVILLKVTGLILISWFWVTSIVWIPVIFFIIIFALYGFFKSIEEKQKNDQKQTIKDDDKR